MKADVWPETSENGFWDGRFTPDSGH